MALWFLKPEEPARPVLDTVYLARLAGHIGEPEMREILADGMLELADRLDRLAELSTPDEVAVLVHDISGAAGHLGLSAMSLAAVETYRLARSDTPPPVAELIAPVIARRGPSLDALGRYCADAKAADGLDAD